MKRIIFFNNKGGIGKTTLIYHLGWMLSELGHRCLFADLDPQANLTAMCLSEPQLDDIYNLDDNRDTIMSGLRAISRGTGDIQPVALHPIRERLGIIGGDLALSTFEDKLSDNWNRCLSHDEAAFRISSAFHRIVTQAAQDFEADYCLIDVGPNLGALNRVLLLSADAIIVPMAADLFSLQGLKNLGRSLQVWRREWQDRLARKPSGGLDLPSGQLQALGYVVMQHSINQSRPVKAYTAWMERIPNVFRQYVLEQDLERDYPSVTDDPYCLGLLKHYHSLAPLSMAAQKPIFLLKPADGAIGAHVQAVQHAYRDFKKLSLRIVGDLGQAPQSAAP